MSSALTNVNPEEFTKKDYWNKFSANLGKVQFEWYGNWDEIAETCNLYVKPKDKILHVGIGNSDLAARFADHLIAQNQIAIDIADKAILFQKKKFARAGILYKTADITTLDETLSDSHAVFDKGTLDAMLPEENSPTEIPDKMFDNIINNILPAFGRYCIVTLGQAQVLDFLIKKLQTYKNIAVKIHVTHVTKINERFQVPVYMFVVIKMPKDMPFVNIVGNSCLNGDGHKIESYEKIIEFTAAEREFALFQGELSQRWYIGEEKAIEFTQNDKVKYKLVIHDRNFKSKDKAQDIAAFVVPLGREADWIFSDVDGRTSLSKQCMTRRLVFIFAVGKSFEFKSMKHITEELSQTIQSLYPPGTSQKYKAPFLSTADDIGERRVVASDAKENIYVYDFKGTGEEDWTRRMVFGERDSVIQSDVLLDSRGKPDHSDLYGDYYIATMSAIMTIQNLFEMERIDILVLGVGGGCLLSHIHKYLPNAYLTGVEISEIVINLAEKHFDLKTSDPRMNIVHQDADIYLKQTSPQQFDIVMLDINGNDPSESLICPAPFFWSKDRLQQYNSLLKDEDSSLFIMNVLCRSRDRTEKILEDFSKPFKQVDKLKSQQTDLNTVLIGRKENKHNLEHAKVVKANLARLGDDYEPREYITSSYKFDE